MKNFKKIAVLLLTSICIISCGTIRKVQHESYLIPIVNNEESNLSKISNNTPRLQLLNKAEAILDQKTKSILDKKRIPPSGNMKDYVSIAIYYWPEEPNSTKPWKYKDGSINKIELSKTDHNNYYEMLEAIKNLSLTYYYYKDEKYAKKCAEIIDLWFINDSTKMNPHFNFAQGIPGKTDGTPSGIIDSRGILWVIDAIDFIKTSEHWGNAKDQKFRNWIDKLYDWLLNSEFGQREGKAKNNHGTFYELQIIKLAMYLDDNENVLSYFERVKNRIGWQISKDGSQPIEMERASAHMYSTFNLSALVEIALIANLYEIDLWSYKTDNSGSIEDAVNYLVTKYEINDTKPFNGKVSYKNLLRILPKANEITKGKYNKVIEKIKSENRNIDLTELYFVN